MATYSVELSLIVRTTAQWAAETKVPYEGAPCVETTSDGKTKFKVGDGLRLWKNLPYVDGTELTSAAIMAALSDTLGKPGGIATLDASGKVPEAQLPSYVDDVVEGYYNSSNGKFYKEYSFTTEIPGEAGKIYIDLDTNSEYRWSGSAFVPLPKSTIVTASTNNGNVSVNGADVKVYSSQDDAALQAALDNKLSLGEKLVLNCTL